MGVDNGNYRSNELFIVDAVAIEHEGPVLPDVVLVESPTTNEVHNLAVLGVV
jgi:hypothetical protein